MDAALRSLTDDGGSRVVVITGAPGTGRSSLLHDAVARATRMGAMVGFARATPAERDIPYGVATRLLDALPDGVLDGVLDAVPGSGPERVVGLATALVTAARHRPLVLVVDDVQWADPESDALLCTVLRRLHHAPVVLLVATIEAWPSAALSDVAPPDWDCVLRLGPLSEDEVRKLCGEVCGVVPDAEFVRHALTAGRGNAGVLREALAEFARSGRRPVAAEAADLVAMVNDQRGRQVTAVLDTLPPQSVALLRLLAVADGELDAAVLATLAGAGRRLTDVVAGLRATGLVAETDPARVADPVVGERALAGLTIQARRALRASVAELAHRVAAPDDVVVRILHGVGKPGSPWAVDVLRRAAGTAVTGGRERDAVDMIRTALGAELTAGDRAGLLIDLAAAVVLESPEASDRALSQAITGPDGPSGIGEDTGKPALAAADLLISRGSADIARRAIRRRLDALAALPGSRESAAERTVLAALHASARGCLHTPQAECPQRIPELPERPGDALVAGIAARRVAVRGAELERAVTLAKVALSASFAEQPLTTPRIAACTALLLADHVEEAEAALTAVIQQTRRKRLRSPAATALMMFAVLCLHRGRLDEGTSFVTAALEELPLPSWHPLMRPWPVACKALIELRRGDLEAAERTIAGPLPGEAERGFVWSYLLYARGSYALAAGDPATAVGELTECGRRLTARQWRNPVLLRWRPLAAQALCDLGDDLEQARMLLADDLRAATAWGTPSAIGGAYLAAGIAFDDVGSAERIAKAERLLRGSPIRLMHAEALTAQAVIELGRGARDGAFALLEQATRIVDELGTTPLAPHIQQRLHGGARPREPRSIA